MFGLKKPEVVDRQGFEPWTLGLKERPEQSWSNAKAPLSAVLRAARASANAHEAPGTHEIARAPGGRARLRRASDRLDELAPRVAHLREEGDGGPGGRTRPRRRMRTCGSPSARCPSRACPGRSLPPRRHTTTRPGSPPGRSARISRARCSCSCRDHSATPCGRQGRRGRGARASRLRS